MTFFFAEGVGIYSSFPSKRDNILNQKLIETVSGVGVTCCLSYVVLNLVVCSATVD